MDCSIETEKSGENAIVMVAGYIDAHTFEELEDEVQGLLDDEVFRIAMELSKVNYISSAGIGVLVNIQANCQGSGGNLVLINPADCLREVFQMFGIWELFTVVPTKAEALRVLESGEIAPSGAPPAAPPPPRACSNRAAPAVVTAFWRHAAQARQPGSAFPNEPQTPLRMTLAVTPLHDRYAIFRLRRDCSRWSRKQTSVILKHNHHSNVLTGLCLGWLFVMRRP